MMTCKTQWKRFGIHVLFATLIILNIISPEAFGWYSAEWKFRIPIQVSYSGGSAVEGYQLKLTVSYQEGMNCDFSDIRFTQLIDGVETELPYFIESYTDCGSATVWVKMVKLDVGNNLIYMYFGNENAVSESDPDSVFILYDDFEGSSLDTTKWRLWDGSTGWGRYEVSDSQIHLWNIHDRLNNPGVAIISNTRFDCMNVMIETRIRAATGSIGIKQIIGDVLRNGAGKIVVMHHPGYTNGFRKHRISTLEGCVFDCISPNCVEGGEYVKDFDFHISTTIVTPGKIIGVYRGERLEVNTPPVDDLNPTNCVLWTGYVADDYDNTGVYVDWVRVRMYADPEPSYSFGNVERKPVGVPCTSDDECESGHCAADYDGDGAWCMPTTSCAHDGVEYENGEYAPECYSSTKAIKCQNGEWVVVSCGLLRFCKNGVCLWRDSDGDGVPDRDDQCPNTPSGCEVYNNGCPKVPFTYHIKNDISQSCPGSSIPVDPEHYCLSTQQNPAIKFYLKNSAGNLYPANSDPYCDPLYGTEGWHDVEEDRYYCEFSIPSSVSPGTYTLIAEYELGGRTYQDIIKSNFVVKSQCSLNVKCGHGGHMTSTPAVNVDFSGCKNVGGVYYCKKGASVSVTQINTVVPHCSNGVTGSAVTPGILAWVYSGNVFEAEKDNKYAGCSLPNPLSNTRTYLYSLTQGFKWPCDISWRSGASLKRIDNIYTFQSPGSYTLYLDMINAVCDSPDYICPTRSKLCAIGSMSNDYRGLEEIDHYTIRVVDPDVVFVSTPPSPQIINGKDKLELTWKLKNTGYGKINIQITPVCPTGWRCDVTPTIINGVDEGAVVYVTLTLYNKIPAEQVSVKTIQVGINVKYVDSYGLYSSRTKENKVEIILDNQAPKVSLTAPSGYGWSASNLPFRVICDDNPYDNGYGTYGGCSKIYYVVVDAAESCPQDLSSYNEYTAQPQAVLTYQGSVECSQGRVCKKKVCFAGEDRFSQRSGIFESEIFKIDKEPPKLQTNVLPSPVLSSNYVDGIKETFFINVSCDDGDGSGCKNIKVYDVAKLPTTCSTYCNGLARCVYSCEFESPDCSIGIHEFDYTTTVTDMVGNTNTRTFRFEVKWNEGCDCIQTDECYPGLACIKSECTKTSSIQSTAAPSISVSVVGGGGKVVTSPSIISVPLGGTARVVIKLKNTQTLPETYSLKINTFPSYPWSNWVCFEQKCRTPKSREAVIVLDEQEEVMIPILIHGYSLTINPVTLNVTVDGLALGAHDVISFQFSVVEPTAESASESELPGIVLANILAIVLIGSTLLFKSPP